MRDFERRLEMEIPALRRYARVLSRDRERAEDLLQDCLERALSRRRLWRPVSMRGWLFRMMRNLYLNSIRDADRRPVNVPLDENYGSQAADQTLRVEVNQVLDAFEQLPDAQREALLLIAVESLSYREAARVLGVPEGTVVSRVSRARERLRVVNERGAPVKLRRVK